MKRFLVSAATLTGVILLLFSGCEENGEGDITPPMLNLYHIGHITENSAMVGVAFWPGHHSSSGQIPFIDAGLVWKEDETPTLEDHDGIFTHAHHLMDDEFNTALTIEGLSPGTSYLLRAYGINLYDTVYSVTMDFVTDGDPSTDPGVPGDVDYGDGVTDIDGNEYLTVIIGEQEWMAENLRVLTYSDGAEIEDGSDGGVWVNLSTGGYAWYENDEESSDPYGALYNWYAVETGKLCPDGWRVPSDTDWTELINHLGGEGVAGGKLKAAGTKEEGTGLWDAPNEGATNESGFTALPGGHRTSASTFYDMGNSARFWSTNASNDNLAWRILLHSYFMGVELAEAEKKEGLSVRCLKD